MTYYEIEEGITPPPPRAKHPAKTLVPGQSMVVPAFKDAVYSRQLIKQRGCACRTKKLDDNSGYRAWCIDPNVDQGE